MSIDDLWYKNAIIYCLDVEKYIDGTDDGVGDFVGLTRKLDYLSGLGVTCIWLQPFYPSPNRDNGYDVSDYYGVHPELGTMDDLDELLTEATRRGIRAPWWRYADRVQPGTVTGITTGLDHSCAWNAAQVEVATMATPGRSWSVFPLPSTTNASFTPGRRFTASKSASWTRPPVAGHFT